MSEKKVRVRFAPSPTGYLHVGGARTALYNYLFAKHHGGDFVLRVEDTDEERSTDEALKMQLEDLKWLGLNWDEGPEFESLADSGEHGPYRQSQRKEIYKKYADQLLADGRAYYCFMTDAEIEQQREEAKKLGRQINSPYRDMSPEEAQQKLAAGESATVRFRIPDEDSEFVFRDLIRGEVRLPSQMVNDFVILRTGGMPVYNFCCAVDDALMGMTHVFRAEEHLNNTLRQMMIYQALGFELPQFGHLSIILGEDKQKLSKRHGATSVHEYAKKGFLKEALINFVALLGWSHPKEKEIMPLQEMIDRFSTDRLKASPAVFDETKFRWMNSQYLREMSVESLWSEVEPRLKASGMEPPSDGVWQKNTLSVFSERMETFEDAVELYEPLLKFDLDASSQSTFEWEKTRDVIGKWGELLSASSESHLTAEQFGELQNQVKDACGVKGKHLFMPIRVAVIGKPQGADLKLLVPLLSVTELKSRAESVLKESEKWG